MTCANKFEPILKKIMTDFANFLFINEISKTEIAEYLGVQNSFITKLSKGEKKLPQDKREKIMNNHYGWDTSPLEGRIIQSIGGHSNHNTVNTSDAELWRKLCEEKDKRIATLEQLVSVLQVQNRQI